METHRFHSLQQRHLKTVRLLLDHGANLECRDKNKSTPQYKATVKGQCDIVELLLVDRGVDANCTSNRGDLPLHRASASGDLPIARVLFKKGAADATSRTPDGQTPLDISRQRGHKQVVDLLTPPPRAPTKTPKQWRFDLRRRLLQVHYGHVLHLCLSAACHGRK
jgi:ankyrin repeat protein